MIPPIAWVLLCSFVMSLAAPGRQGVDDAELRAAVERFFALQQAEDVAGYLSLWSAKADRPRREQLEYIFKGGDDTYSDIALLSTYPTATGVRVRVTATRERVTPSRVPDRPPSVFRSTTTWSLSYVREAGEWKLVREGGVADGLAESLIAETSPEARQRLLDAESDLVNRELVVAISRRAGQAAQNQMYADAQVGFERMREIARLVGDTRFEGEALQNLANAMYFQRNLAGALEAYEARLSIETTREDDEGRTAALLGVATVRYSLAEYATALTTYREALALQEKLGDDASPLARTLISIGNILYLQGDYTGAIADYARSRDISAKANNPMGVAEALEGLARVFAAQGDYRAALDALTGVLADARARNDRNDQGNALLSIADVHFRLGNLDSARSAIVESREHFEAIKHLALAGRSWQALALVDLVASRFILAEDEYRKGVAICTTAADHECAAAAVAGLAFAETAQEKYPQGIASYQKAIEAFTKLKRPEQSARANVGLSRALTRSGAFGPGLEAATRARTEAETLANDDVLWRALVAEAEALRRLRERPKALASAQAAVAAVDRLLEVARTRPAAPVARDTSSAFATLALLQAEDGDAAAAFESAERMRVHDLRVLLAPGERDIYRGMTPAEREEERRRAGELVSLHAQMTRERSLPKPDAARIRRLEAAVADATAKREAEQQALFARLPALRTWRGFVTPATRADVETVLTDANSLLVEFVIGDETLLTILARRDDTGVRFSAQFEAATRGTIAERVAKLLLPATMKDVRAWRQSALELIPGLDATFGKATRVIVVPHEVLWRVPFEAWPMESQYLADTAEVAYLSSITAAVRAHPASSEPVMPAGGSRVVAVTAPELTAAVVEELGRTAPDWAIRPAAPAEAESRAILEGVDPSSARLLLGPEATEAAVIEQLPTADVIHIGAPFRVNGASPLFSSTLLAAAPSTDGTLESREVMNVDLRATATIFSDGAAISMREAADEVGAVAWSWRAAGVPIIVLPRWTVDEQVSTAVLKALHARLRAGDSPIVGLRTARHAVRKDDATAAPFFWAGWVAVGAVEPRK